MLDFKKLMDPQFQAEVQAEQRNRQAALEAKEAKQRAAVQTCLGRYEDLSADERSLVRSCQQLLNSYRALSEKQESWLFGIAKRLG